MKKIWNPWSNTAAALLYGHETAKLSRQGGATKSVFYKLKIFEVDHIFALVSLYEKFPIGIGLIGQKKGQFL